MSNVFDKLNDILKDVNLENVEANSMEYRPIPDGYYLCQVMKAELKETQQTHYPMASFQFQIVENGVDLDIEGDNITHIALDNTKGRWLFINWVLKDESSVKRFVSDMLKFEGNEGESLLTKECFASSEFIEESIEALTGSRIYIKVSTTKNKQNEDVTWNNLISWSRAKDLTLE